MGYIQLIYNPMAGQRTFRSRLDYMLQVFQSKGYELRIYRTMNNNDFKTFFDDKSFESCDGVIVAGGDGSFNHVVHAMKKNKLDIPVGIIPAGTANDYAKHLGIPDNFQQAIKVLSKLKTRKLDLGIVNG